TGGAASRLARGDASPGFLFSACSAGSWRFVRRVARTASPRGASNGRGRGFSGLRGGLVHRRENDTVERGGERGGFAPAREMSQFDWGGTGDHGQDQALLVDRGRRAQRLRLGA